MATNKLVLLASATVNGNGAAVPLQVVGRFGVFATGTFGTGNTKLQASHNGTDWFDVSGSALSAPGMVIVEIIAAQVRAVLTAGVSPSVSVEIVQQG